MIIPSTLVVMSLFLPTIVNNGKPIDIIELVLYFGIILYGMSRIYLRQPIVIKLSNFSKPFLFYFSFMSVLILILIVIYGSIDNDVYILRTLAQGSIFLLLLELYFNPNDKKIFDRYVLFLFCILSIPALITLMQGSNVLGIKDITYELYKPNVLDKELLYDGFRFPSVFKDYFTSSVYFLAVSISAYYYYLVSETKSKKLFYLVVFFLTFVAQLYSGRTGLIFTPIAIVMISFLVVFSEQIGIRKDSIFTFLGIMLSVLISGFFAVLFLGLLEIEHIMWAFEFFLNDELESASTEDLKNSTSYFYQTLAFSDLIEPYRNSEVFNHNNNYTDSFYAQEIMRHGIYGIIIYIFFSIYAIWKNKKNIFIISWVILFGILNYKGGNVFFLNKAMFPIFFIMFTIAYHRVHFSKSSHV